LRYGPTKTTIQTPKKTNNESTSMLMHWYKMTILWEIFFFILANFLLTLTFLGCSCDHFPLGSNDFFAWFSNCVIEGYPWCIVRLWRAPKFLVRPKKGPSMLKSGSSWNLVPLPASNTKRGERACWKFRD